LRLVTQTQFTVALTTLATLLVAAAVKLTTVLLLFHAGVPRKVLQGQDAFLTGVLAAGFVWVFLEAERARRREQEMQIRIVADLNHHLRNALDVILSSEYLHQSEKASAILESVARIENALTVIIGTPKKGPASAS
jgi:hypothetical protein